MEGSYEHYFQVGSADHHVHYYDLRSTRAPLHVFSGHRKAVSYVKFISPTELASASTDSTLRLWDVRENTHVCILLSTLGNMNKYSWLEKDLQKDPSTCMIFTKIPICVQKNCQNTHLAEFTTYRVYSGSFLYLFGSSGKYPKSYGFFVFLNFFKQIFLA